MNAPTNLELFKGLLKMMEIRGYNISDRMIPNDMTSQSFDNIIIPWFLKNPTSIQQTLIEKGKTSSRYMLSSVFDHITRPNERCVVYFAEIGNSKTVPLSETCTFGELYIQERNDPLQGGITTGILVSTVKLSPPAQQRLNEFKNDDHNIYFQHFLDIELLYDPNQSIWGSKCVAFTLEESKKFLIENGLLASQLPRIDSTKPLCKYNGIRPFQIVELYRHTFIPSTPIHNEIFYRLAF